MDQFGTSMRDRLQSLGRSNNAYYKHFQAGIALADEAAMSAPAVIVAALDLSRWLVRDMIRSHFTDDSCAATAGFTADIMTGMGVEAEAVPCFVTCLSPVYLKWAVEHSRLLPETAEEIERLRAAGGKIVVIAGEPPADATEVHTLAEAIGVATRAARSDEVNRFPGHVINILDTGDHRFLADLSIDQIQGRGLVAEPIIVPIPSDAFSEPGAALAIMNNGVLTVYERIDDQSFRQSPDFTRTTEDDPSFGGMMNAIKTAMAMVISTSATALASGGVVRGTPSSALGEFRPFHDPEVKAAIIDGFMRLAGPASLLSEAEE